MNVAGTWEAESDRLATLDHYRIVDSAPEPGFDELVELAAYVCAAPFAAINLIDERQQWSKASIGFGFDSAPRGAGLCDTAIGHGDILVVPNTLTDARFSSLPVVLGPPYVRFYAGAPLVAPNGSVLGMLCVADREPRSLDERQLRGLAALSRQTMNLFELRRIAAERARTVDEERRVREDAPPLRLAMQEFDLHACLERCIALFVNQPISAGIQVASSIHGSVPRFVRGDAQRIGRAVTLVLADAAKRGSIALDADLASGDDRACVVRIAVTSQAAAADASTTELELAHDLITLLESTLHVASDGREMTTSFLLRLGTPLPADEHMPPDAPRVLLAGHPGAAANAARRAIRRIGYGLAETGSGTAAFDVLRRARSGGEAFRAAIVWAPLPDMSAREFAHEIAADDALAELPLVLVDDMSRELDAGAFSAVLDTPIRTRQLVDAISSFSIAVADPRVRADGQPAFSDRPAVEAALHDLERDLGLKIVKRLCTIFLDDTELRMQRLQDAVFASDAAQTRLIAHAIRGSLTNFRAQRAIEATTALEAEADSARRLEVFVRLQSEMDVLRSFVSHFAVVR